MQQQNLLHFCWQSSLQICLQDDSFLETITRPSLCFFVFLNVLWICVVLLESYDDVDEVMEVLLEPVIGISVDDCWIPITNGKHDVVLKQKFPSLPSLKNPKRLTAVSFCRKSCCSQSTAMNSFCGNSDAK